jgi:hypothetical protein
LNGPLKISFLKGKTTSVFWIQFYILIPSNFSQYFNHKDHKYISSGQFGCTVASVLKKKFIKHESKQTK